MTTNRVALELARRYGNTPAWGAALRIVDRAHSQLGALWLYLYSYDQQRIAREEAKRREIDRAAKQAVAEVGALVERLKREAAEVVDGAGSGLTKAGTDSTETGAESKESTLDPDVARLMAVGRALGRKVIEDMSLRMATGKRGRN